MNSASERRSLLMPQNGRPSAPPVPASPFATARLNPVPTGSTKTRSVKRNQVSALSTRRAGGSGMVPWSPSNSRLGPSAPTCSHAALDPGPPLNTNVIGRVARILAVLVVADVEHGGLRVALVEPHPQRPGGGRVGELGAVDGNGMTRLDRLIGRRGLGGRSRCLARVRHCNRRRCVAHREHDGRHGSDPQTARFSSHGMGRSLSRKR